MMNIRRNNADSSNGVVPEEGKHVLTLMDELGNEKTRSFEVIGKSE